MVGANMGKRAGVKKARTKKTKKYRGFIYYDFNLAFLMMFACAIGLIIIYSASAYIAKSKNLESTYFLTRQLKTIAAGFGLMLVVSAINYRKLKARFKLPLPGFLRGVFIRDSFTISIPGLLLFLITVLQGYTSFFAPVKNGARRWISIEGITLQPSELAKFVVIVFGAYICAKSPRDKNTLGRVILNVLYILPLLGFIMMENLSAGLIVAIIYGAIIFANSKRLFSYIGLAVAIGASIRPLVNFFGGYRSARFEILDNVETSEKGQQILQGLYAIASGGMFGKGLGGSEQKYGRVPEAYNDMIFTIICEEFGVFGGIAIILLFALILFRMWIVILNARDRFGALLGVGIMSQIGVQVVLNILVVTSKIPSTGVILPFISFGGTAVVIMLAEIGVFLNISLQIRYSNKLAYRSALREQSKNDGGNIRHEY